MDNTRARDDPGSHNHHHDRAAVWAFFAARAFDWWEDRRMSVAILFSADAPNQLWLVDITEHKSVGGKLY